MPVEWQCRLRADHEEGEQGLGDHQPQRLEGEAGSTPREGRLQGGEEPRWQDIDRTTSGRCPEEPFKGRAAGPAGGEPGWGSDRQHVCPGSPALASPESVSLSARGQ